MSLPYPLSWIASLPYTLATYMSQPGSDSSLKSELNIREETFEPGSDTRALNAERDAPPIEGRFYQKILTGAKGIYELHVFAERSPAYFELCNRREDTPNHRKCADFRFYCDSIDQERLAVLHGAWAAWISRINEEEDENVFEKAKSDLRAMQQFKNVQQVVDFMKTELNLEDGTQEVMV